MSGEPEPMDDRVIRVRARIRLLATADGGRTSVIKGSYRPNHNFFGPNDHEMTTGFIDLPDGEELNPGESMDVQISFWNWAGLDGQVYPGREWRIQEGCKLVGIGTIVEVLPVTD